jgi:predicted AlkP superfamily pyrophosphatase or phosphodiesterase
MRRLLLLLTAVSAACGFAAPPAIVILISIDGFRWDYLHRFAPPVLSRLAAEGVRSEGLIPQFPSTTFPNHYTIVTGQRLARHGIISNNMETAAIPGRFSMSNRDVLADPRWWGGEPIWNTAERQGKVAAAMFWPGSESAIGGRYATFWREFDDDLPHEQRVGQLLEWLRLPEGRRPSFLTLYFSDVDSAGHRDGPDSPEVRGAVARVDRSVASLVAGVDAIGLADRVHYIVVSDHGMAQLSTERMIVLDDYLNPDSVNVVDWSPVLAVSPKDGNVEALYQALKDKHPSLAVYRSREIPEQYGLAGHPRVQPVVGIAAEGWFITSRRDVERWKAGTRRPPAGAHGYDPRLRSMHGLFVASGPRLARGTVVPPFENIHIYDLMCALLEIAPAPNDGDRWKIGDVLRDR